MPDEPLYGIIVDGLAKRAESFRNSGPVLSSESLGFARGGNSIYSGSVISNTSADFAGDWRSVDSWQRLDLWMVRNRSRQLERGNDMCKAYKRHMINNILGHKGFVRKVQVVSGKQYGDTSDGVSDDDSNAKIAAGLDLQERPENLTTRKRLSSRNLDRLLLSRLIFDGEFILRKRPGFANDCRFAWQPINADYLDHNLNRIEDGRDQNGVQVANSGNMTRMGVELDKVDKFPVAYWFFARRPNDTQYNYNEVAPQVYIRVPAAEVIHVFVQTEDEEQTRGFPWIFSAMINLFRSGKFQEAALINATIGASKGMFYTKEYPQGFEGAPADYTEFAKGDQGYMVDKVQPGMAVELPLGVKPIPVDYRYPDAAMGPFLKAMGLGTSLAFGTSYATTTGDLSEANFVSSRLGQNEEREEYKSLQQFFIESWKEPQAEEQLYRGLLSRTIPLPISKIRKFEQFEFRGRRWEFVQPVDDRKAKSMALDDCTLSVGQIIEETTQEDEEDLYKRIQKSNKLLAKYGLARVHGTYQFIDPRDDGTVQPVKNSGDPNTGVEEPPGEPPVPKP